MEPFPHDPNIKTHNLLLDRENCDIEQARAIIRQQNLDVFIAHFSWSEFLWVPFLLHGLNTPLIYAEHSDPAIIESERWNRAEHLACVSACDSIVLLLDEFSKAYPDFLQKRITVIPNAVDRPLKTAAPEKPNNGTFTLLGAGRFVDSFKQFSMLIGAFAILVKRFFPDWRLRLCGDGPDMKTYQNMAAGIGIADKVFFPGMVSDMTEEYASANLFCIPSRYEGFGLVTVEAQRHGLPVIGFSKCPATKSLIYDGHTGMLAPEMTLESLTKTLLSLMENNDLRKVMGANAMTMSAKYDPNIVYNKWIELIQNVAGKTEKTKLSFALDKSDEAKTEILLKTILMRKNVFSPFSLFDVEVT